MKKLYFIILPLVVFVLQSCDPAYQVFYTVENATNDSLLAKIPKSIANGDTIKYLPPHQEADIYNETNLGYGSKINCCACGLPFKTVAPKDTTHHNTKDIKAESNWILEHDGRDVVRCRLKVNQSDIH